MKIRLGPDGAHFLDRKSGLNILFDEARPMPEEWSAAPRQVSIALTNLCDLQCFYCYAPKSRAVLAYEDLMNWLEELDREGCHGVGFGGGEPTLHPRFCEICDYASRHTQLAVTFTTHGHRLNAQLLDRIRGHVHFIRISVDGVGITYERLRGRSFTALVARLKAAREVAPLGINVVVNTETLSSLNALADLAQEVCASELLLLPQRATSTISAADSSVHKQLLSWILVYGGKPRLAISESDSEGIPTCHPLPMEVGLRSYAHIDAHGILRRSSYEPTGVPIGSGGFQEALRCLESFNGDVS